MIGLNLALIALLIALTAFFVAAEFAFVKIRSSRVEQLILEGNKNAIHAQKIVHNLDGYLSACQLGITVTALGLGWLGESTLEKIFSPILHLLNLSEKTEHIVVVFLAFFVMTYVHVVIGELAPKTLAIQKAEFIVLVLAKPLIFFYKVSYPFIWLLNGSARKITHLFGLKSVNEHGEVHTEEELRLLMSESYQNGEISQAEYRYVNRIFNFDEKLAREIMIPRVDMIVLDLELGIEENLKIIKKEEYTRFPVVSGDKDEIIGVINAKKLLLAYIENPNLDLKELTKPALTILEHTPVKSVLKQMQMKRSPIAILIDEYGGTSGLITMEDILEEIVGEIRDEFDGDEKPNVEQKSDDDSEFVFDGKVLISEVNEHLHLSLESEGYDTIGGFLFSHNSELKKDQSFDFENVRFTVLERDKNRYKRIMLTKIKIEN